MYRYITLSRALELVFLSILCVTSALAAPQTFSFVSTLSGAAVWENAGETEHLEVIPGMQTKYKSDKETSLLGEGELFLGTQYDPDENWELQFGLAYGGMNDATLEGKLYNGVDGGNYSYKLEQTRLVAKVKMVGDLGKHFKNWVSVSAGAAFNKSYDFTNNSLTLTMPNFEDYSTTAFTYSAGVGIEYILSHQWHIGMGYQFSDWGKSHLGDAPGQMTHDRLDLDHFYTNGVIFNITYLLI